jgi:hypothetical protein
MAKGIVSLLTVVLIAGSAGAYTSYIEFREGGGEGYVGLGWDVVSISTTGAADADWESEALAVSGDTSTEKYYLLLGLTELLEYMPIQSSDITSATLTLTGYSGDGDSVIAYRLTSLWLYWGNEAGAMESDTDEYYEQISAEGGWNDEYGAYLFSSADYDDSVSATGTWGTAYRQPLDLDVTDLVKAMYSADDNEGWVVTNLDSGDDDISIYNPGGGGDVGYNPTLRIDFTTTRQYVLSVNNGTGGGQYYPGEEVGIAADDPASGQAFTGWIGDTLGVGDCQTTETTIVVPFHNTTVTASYSLPVIWMDQVGTTGDDKATSIVMDSSGNIVVGGQTAAELVSGERAGDVDVFVRKYTPTGTMLWTHQYGSADEDLGTGVSTDGNDDVYIAGRTEGDFETEANHDPYEETQDVFLAKLAGEDGDIVWCDEIGTTMGDHGYCVVADSSGKVHISGCTSGDLYGTLAGGDFDAFLAAYDAESGTYIPDSGIQFDQSDGFTHSEENGLALRPRPWTWSARSTAGRPSRPTRTSPTTSS